jgi:hypothetical protein
MSRTAGARLGPYEIQSLIGAGGMGEVYKARDTRLDRSVAIKILPAHLSADPERRARFAREAKTIAGLNHPHICTLHDVGEHEGTTYLVMEHLTGETLAQRLEKGPLPLEQVLAVSTEIADALTAAHRQGVIHRDLKPGNVMLTKTGAKLLDFGLAKLKGHGEQPAASSLASAPTQSAQVTAEGTIIGTLQYMAPEQVEGKPADARTDLWALGAILYEMLTGKRAFEGASAAGLIGHIMNAEPPALATLQPLTPPALDRLVRQCLAKAPDDRPDTAHDVANDLRWLREAGGAHGVMDIRPRHRPGLRTALIVAGVLAAAVIGASVMWLLRPPVPRPSLARLSLDVRPAEEVNAGGWDPPWVLTLGGAHTALAWTPDGHALVFVGRHGGVQQLYVRRLDAAEAQPLAGAEGAQVLAVSADGQWVAFWASGAIKKVPLGGGLAVDLAPGIRQPPSGLAWNTNGSLFFGGADGRIWTIPAEGTPAAVTTVGEGELGHTLPALLPGGRALLYTVRKGEWSWGEEQVVAQPLPTGERKVLLTDATDARYVPTGHLVFVRRGVLYAVPFDVERLQLRGRELPVLDGVAQAVTGGNTGDVTGGGQFAVAPTGTLAWIPSAIVPNVQGRLVTVDRRGRATALAAPERSYGPVLRLSPDQRRLAVTVRTLTETCLWTYDLTRPAPLLRLTTGGEVMVPMWGPGGQQLVFRWLEKGRRALVMQPADGTAPPHVLASGFFSPSFLAPDGRIAAVSAQDIVMVAIENGKGRVEPLFRTPEAEAWPVFSPDGSWLAYGSNRTGRNEVYVRPYPGLGTAFPVSVDGGDSPAWHPGGHEIFFVSLADPAGTRRMMAVTFAPGSPPRVGQPKELFSFVPRDLRLGCVWVRCFDVTADGQRFYAVQSLTPPSPLVVTHISLIQNWFEELKAKVPTGR